MGRASIIDGPNLKLLFLLFGARRSFFVCCLALWVQLVILLYFRFQRCFLAYEDRTTNGRGSLVDSVPASKAAVPRWILASGTFFLPLIQEEQVLMRYKRIGYNLNVMRQSACLVINPIMVDGYAALFNCTPVDRASDSMMAPT